MNLSQSRFFLRSPQSSIRSGLIVGILIFTGTQFLVSCSSTPKKPEPGRFSLAISQPAKAAGTVGCFGSADAKGYKTGIWWCFYNSGKLRALMEFKNGFQDGTTDTWGENGQKLFESEWKGGRISGLSKVFFGKKCHQVESNYLDGFLHGVTRHYDSKCRLRVVMNYINGVLNNEYKEYWTNGKIKIRGSFHEGEEAGYWTFLDCNGKAVLKETDLDKIQECPQDDYNPFAGTSVEQLDIKK